MEQCEALPLLTRQSWVLFNTGRMMQTSNMYDTCFTSGEDTLFQVFSGCRILFSSFFIFDFLLIVVISLWLEILVSKSWNCNSTLIRVLVWIVFNFVKAYKSPLVSNNMQWELLWKKFSKLCEFVISLLFLFFCMKPLVKT